MDTKQLCQRLAKTSSLEYRETADMVSAVISTLSDTLCEGDAVAIPGFGTFETVKRDEEIVPDLSTGGRILMPPVIEVKFTTSGQLKKNL